MLHNQIGILFLLAYVPTSALWFQSHGYLTDGGTNVCRDYYYEQQKFYTDCGFWHWSACTRYRSVQTYRTVCCSGYSSDSNRKRNCPYPICAGRINPHRACYIYYNNDTIVYRPGKKSDPGQRDSGGTCISPGHCGTCNDGFYADGAYCRICPKIENCLHRRCVSAHSYRCEYCDGEILDEHKQYWRAYIRGINGNYKECIKACSWRPDSTRCFPGSCQDHDKESSCKCIEGFGGYQCDKIVRESTISYALGILKGPSSTADPVESPVNPNEPLISETKWTKQNVIKTADIKVTAVFKSKETPPKPDPNGQNHFITEFEYGITQGEVRLSFFRDSDANFTLPPIVKSCHTGNGKPTTERFDCSDKITLSGHPVWGVISSFLHDDRVVFSYSITNGGRLSYIDRDSYREPSASTPRNEVTIHGRTVNREFTFHWDLEDPYNRCLRENGRNCTVPPVEAQDVSNSSVIPIQWKGWVDDLAGVDGYLYELYELHSLGSMLTEAGKLQEGKINSSSDGNMYLNVSAPGMYSLLLYAIDKAGNDKAARALFLYDDASKVEINSGKHIRVKQSTTETMYSWISVDDTRLKVNWKGKFKNENHHAKNWLETIKRRPNLEAVYDDRYGKRTASAVPHRQGIVRFETHHVVLSPHISQQQAFKQTENVLDEATILPVTWDDGDRLDITVRAFDILDVYVDDTITVYKDSSPPEIENLWLSNGDRVNVSVHSVEDFSKMTIEWNAFDYHSGLDSLQWRLFDNFTKTDILHGHDNLHAQGNAMNITECQEKYGGAPRGPACYCTSFHGCFHQHFFVIPKINNHSGLIVGKDKGVHDSDYYIEVTVVNRAKLKTIVSKKITIDVSPPHEGTVHDGIKGDPEIDYQQDLTLNAHWEGFFDRESGVEFYEYLFSDHCFTNKEFKNSTKTTETYNTFASYHAPVEGSYVISVVAVNRAKENSNVVCSDGVTITTEVPKVTNFVLDGASTRPRLVNDNGLTWYIDGALRRHSVTNISLSCSSILVSNVSILPEADPIFVLDTSICGMSKDLHVFAVVRRVSQFKISWKPTVANHFIHDYEVGLSTTADSIAPDIIPFRTTKHHNHFRLNHPDLPDGKIFYIVIKSITKSGIEGIQSTGPFIIDTSKPHFTGGKIDVKIEGRYLIANWSVDAFEDKDDPYPMNFQFAVGHQPHMYDIYSFNKLIFAGSCKRTIPSTCTALPLHKMKWSLHGHHQYYFTLKATNLAGLSVYQSSLPYDHDVQLPAEGIVFDLPTHAGAQYEQNDIEDIDFTTDNTSLAIKWSGFLHPHQTVAFRACVGSAPKLCDVQFYEVVSASHEKHTFTGLNLLSFRTHFVTIEASTSAGSALVSTDGILVLDTNQNLTRILVREGNNCTDLEELKMEHHEQDTRPKCSENIDYQSSTTSLHVYWTIPNKYKDYIRETWIKLDRRLVDNVWVKFTDFQFVGTHNYVTLSKLELQPGMSYRPVLKFCAEGHCFPVVYGNGVTVVVNPPKTGNMTVVIEGDQIQVQFEHMVDPDIQKYEEAAAVVSVYEWAIGDDVGMHTIWHSLKNITVLDQKHLQFFIPLNSSIDFSKCRKVFIRGYNKVGVWSTMSKEIKTCSVKDGNSLIVPKIVIDAIGEQENSLDGVRRDGYGKDIFLPLNERWGEPDVDYTPFKNVISATWPLLRHHNYSWAVIDAENLDVESYYKDEDTLQLVDPCSYPNAIKCGQTEKEFINAFFNSNEELIQGKRYLVCIHAPRMEIKYEKWTEVLDEVKSCSDGVTVDLTPPIAGHVWIGIDPSKMYQSSTSDMFISWDSFLDVEEFGNTIHKSGVKEYFVGVGSTKGGTDITPYTPVGLVNHFTIHGLRLQDGHEYYATVKDFNIYHLYL